MKKDYEKFFKNNHNMKFIFNNKIQIYNFLLFLIYILFPSTYLSQRLDLRQLSTISEIKMTIKGAGHQNILSPDFQYEESKIERIIINNVSQTDKSKIKYDLDNQINNITIV